jgi:Putative F0F1-ATPase subunit Ca2+/Mg2+ transporter
MKTALALAGAGGTFAGTVIAGLLIGLWLDAHLHAAFWTAVLLFAGLIVGGYAAYRLIASAL